MNPLKKYIARVAMKAMQADPGNELFAQMFEYLNKDLPAWLGKDPQDFIDKGYMYNDLVYSIIKTKQDIARSIDWQVYKVVDQDALKGYKYSMKALQAGKNYMRNLKKAQGFKQKALEEVHNTEINRIIKKPNSYESWGQIIEGYFGWLDLTGNFYLYGLKRSTGDKIQTIHVAPASQVEIILGTTFDPIKGYKLKNWMKGEIEPDNMLHIKNWNPDFDQTTARQLYGMSPLQPAARLLTLDNLGIDTSASSFKNSGVRALIHRAQQKGDIGSEFTADQAEAIKKKIESWQGTDKANSLAATNAPVGVTEIGKSPVDLGVYTAMEKNTIRMCNVLQVPVELFLPGTTFSNKAEARKNMITTGILPKLDILKDRLNNWLVQPYGNFVIDYDMFSIVELQEDLNKIAEMLKGVDWFTLNEKREAMDQGGYENNLADQLWIDPMKMPIDQADYSTGFDEVDKSLEKLNSKVY